MLRILLIAFAAVAGLYLLKKLKRLDAQRRRKVWRESLVLVGVVVAVLVFARFGLAWVGAIVAATWALLRALAPYALRLMPLIQRRRAAEQEQRKHTGSSGNSSTTGAPGPKPKPNQLMSREEALKVLGVEEDASRETILVAYRNLIRKVHPDSPGGSNYLATKLNQAKDVLLG